MKSNKYHTRETHGNSRLYWQGWAACHALLRDLPTPLPWKLRWKLNVLAAMLVYLLADYMSHVFTGLGLLARF